MNVKIKTTSPSRAGMKGRANPVDAHVGGRLRLRRALIGMSQEKLAEAVGLTFQQVQKYERGTNRVSASRLYQFSKILDVPVSYFFDQYKDSSADNFSYGAGMADNAQEGFVEDNHLYDKETIELVRIYYSIKDVKMRKDLLKLIKSMADKLR